MRHRLVLLLLVLVSSAAGIHAAEPSGFGGQAWGDPVPQGWKAHPGKYAKNPVYPVSGDNARLGLVKFDSAELEFGPGGLVRATLFLNRAYRFGGLKRQLDALFGHEGIRVAASPAPESYLWRGERTLATVHYLAEKFPTLLFLCALPEGDRAAADAAARLLIENRLRLCAVIAERMDAALRAMDADLLQMMQSYQQFAPVPYDKSPISIYMMMPGENAQRSFQDLRQRRDVLVEERIKLGTETQRLQTLLLP